MFPAANNSRARLTAVSNRHAKQLSKTHLRALSTKVVLHRETTFALRFLSAARDLPTTRARGQDDVSSKQTPSKYEW